MHPLAARRILRLALGVSLCLAFSQAINWPLSFIAPILTLMVLALPLPPLKLRQAMGLLLVMLMPLLLGMLLLPFLWEARWAGIGLLGLTLFFVFYFSARGDPPLLGTMMVMGLTLVVTIGSVMPTLLPLLVWGLALGSVCGMAFSRIAHGLLPDLSQPPGGPARTGAEAAGNAEVEVDQAASGPDADEVLRRALRSLFVVLPLALLFLFASGSPSYTAVMIKSAALGQKSSVSDSRRLGLSLLASTFWGGVAAVVSWQFLSVWPSLLLFSLVAALTLLIAGRAIFAGRGLHRWAPVSSYAMVTYLILICPSITDSPLGSSASEAFWTRLFLFVLVAVYGTVTVRVFDAWWPARRPEDEQARGVPSHSGA